MQEKPFHVHNDSALSDPRLPLLTLVSRVHESEVYNNQITIDFDT